MPEESSGDATNVVWFSGEQLQFDTDGKKADATAALADDADVSIDPALVELVLGPEAVDAMPIQNSFVLFMNGSAIDDPFA